MTSSPTTGFSDFLEPRGDSGFGFHSTQWSMVIAAADRGTEESRAALEGLCRIYWQPLYAYVRRSGRSKEDAEDLVQGFFADFLERKAVEGVSRERGRFRAYLLVCLKHYMLNVWNRGRSQKRGGGTFHASLDCEETEARLRLESDRSLNPDRLYDREWALALIDQVLRRLQAEAEADGKGERFEQWKRFLMLDRAEIPYEEVAAAMNLSAGAVRVGVHRLRKRYRVLLREEVGRTLASPEFLDEEMRALFAALSE